MMVTIKFFVIFGVISASLAKHDKRNLRYQGRQLKNILEAIGTGLGDISTGIFGTKDKPMYPMPVPLYPVPVYPGGGSPYGGGTPYGGEMPYGGGIPYQQRSGKTSNIKLDSQTKIHPLKGRELNSLVATVPEEYYVKMEEARPPNSGQLVSLWDAGRPQHKLEAIKLQKNPSEFLFYPKQLRYNIEQDLSYNPIIIPDLSEVPNSHGLVTLEDYHPAFDFELSNQNPYRK